MYKLIHKLIHDRVFFTVSNRPFDHYHRSIHHCPFTVQHLIQRSIYENKESSQCPYKNLQGQTFHSENAGYRCRVRSP